jgi:hypothetical protein
MSEDEILMSVCKIFVNPRFDEWNTKTISFALIVALGYNGLDTRKLMIEILDKFYQWYTKSQSDQYMPLHSTEKMYSQKNILRMIKHIKNIDESCITQNKEDNHRIALCHLSDLWVIIDQAIYLDRTTPPSIWQHIFTFLGQKYHSLR